jgi:hypothetical protein
LEDFRAVGIEDHLDPALPVTQVDKDDPAVIPAAVDPAAQFDILVQVRFV